MGPKVILPVTVHRKIMHWVNKSEFEVSGLGKVEVGANGECIVVDAMLLPQKNSATHTDIEPEAVNKAMYEMRETPGQLRFWWHSHVNMNVFWSGTDRTTIKDVGQGGWCIATVFNKKNEMRSAFYSVDGIILPWGRTELFFDEIKTEVMGQPGDTEAWDAEYEKNVTNFRRVHAASCTGGNTYQGTHGTGGTSVLGGATTKSFAQMTKKERKAHKKAQKNLNLLPPPPSGNDADDDSVLDLFDEADLFILKQKGFSDEEIKELEREDYLSVSDIMKFVDKGFSAEEITWCSVHAETNEYTSEQIETMLMKINPLKPASGSAAV